MDQGEHKVQEREEEAEVEPDYKSFLKFIDAIHDSLVDKQIDIVAIFQKLELFKVELDRANI